MNSIEQIDLRQKEEAQTIIDRLMNNQHVSRWDVLQRRFDIRRIINKTNEYDSIIDELDYLIESAKESL